MMNSSSNSADWVQFSSEETGISIALPLGWDRESEPDSDYPTDVYVQSPAEQYSPSITIKIIELPEAEYHQNSYQELSEVLLAEHTQYSSDQFLRVLEQRSQKIDGRSARVDIFNSVDRDTNISVTQYQVTIQLDTAVCGAIAMMKTAQKDDYIPIFDRAVRSIEFN